MKILRPTVSRCLSRSFQPIICLILFCATVPLYGEPREPAEVKAKIRALEKEMAVALVETDVETLLRLWAEDFMVNNPGNTVLSNRAQVMERVHAGIIQYESFAQNIEEIRVYENIVMVMGEETVLPSDGAPGAGQLLKRRFTNIWMRKDDTWILTARHANVIPPRPAPSGP
ncbi:MAG: nuclear transport factor 2 family protein [Verrucomicrobia bacterium]|nr:nuclear transport factor 2 family protein [Verrucomicrobiota bacterium]MCH8514374.1 nuclear transport factor 2 family protein [Kiritimatiellia bacterium]